MKDPLKMLRQVQQMQGRMEKLQKDLETETVEASAGGGAVTVIATGTQKIVSVRIDPDVLGDAEMAQDLVVAAVNEALEKSKQMASEKMSALTASMGLPPGLLG
jgi:DNA-binding YbaB/EbfC family protein